MTISEPSTTLTDYLLAAACFILAARLLGRAKGHRAILLWAGAIGSTGVAAITAGIYHGFRLGMNEVWSAGVWKATMAAIGMGSFFFLSGAAFSAFSGRARKIILVVAVIQLAAYLLWLAADDDFRYAVYNYALAMIFVLGVQVYIWTKRREPSACWIGAGIVVSLLGALIQANGVSIHPHFNHNDLYHVVQTAGVYCFYRGGLLLTDRIT